MDCKDKEGGTKRFPPSLCLMSNDSDYA